MISSASVLKLLENGNGFMVAGVILFAIGLILLVRWLIGVAEVMTRKRHSSVRRIRFRPWNLSVRALTILSLILASLVLVFAGAMVRTYTVFTRQDLVGTLECLDWRPEDKIMVVRFSEVNQGRTQRAQTYSLAGDAWEISAHILRWHNQAHWIGLHTGYRLNQIKGVYLSAEEETSLPHRAYDLRPGRDWAWWVLDRYGEKIPFVSAVYGNAVSRPAKIGEVFDVFVTTSGLSVIRREAVSRSRTAFFWACVDSGRIPVLR